MKCHGLAGHYVLCCFHTSSAFMALLVSAPPPSGYTTAPVSRGCFHAIWVYQRQIKGKTNRKKVLKLDGGFQSTNSHGACTKPHTKVYVFRVSSHKEKGLLKWERSLRVGRQWLSAHHAAKKPKAAPLCCDSRGPFICHFPLDMSWYTLNAQNNGNTRSQPLPKMGKPAALKRMGILWLQRTSLIQPGAE